jgi:hypothetical protein
MAEEIASTLIRKEETETDNFSGWVGGWVIGVYRATAVNAAVETCEILGNCTIIAWREDI